MSRADRVEVSGGKGGGETGVMWRTVNRNEIWGEGRK